jgi:hypothetical protein
MQNSMTKQDVLHQHKQDVIWQIWIPIGFGAVAVLTLGILSALSLQTGTDAAARWGHVATIWLILPFFLVGLMVFMLLTGTIVLVISAMGAVHEYAPLVQHYIQMIASRISGAADKTVQPVIQLRSERSALQRFWVTLRLILLGGYKD